MSDTKRVPVEPTEEMGRVSGMRFKCHCGRAITQWAVNKWADMLAAAPPEDELARLERDIAEYWVFSHVARTDEDFTTWTDTKYLSEWSERYLELRGLLERHPDNPNLVRVKEGE